MKQDLQVLCLTFRCEVPSPALQGCWCPVQRADLYTQSNYQVEDFRFRLKVRLPGVLGSLAPTLTLRLVRAKQNLYNEAHTGTSEIQMPALQGPLTFPSAYRSVYTLYKSKITMMRI